MKASDISFGKFEVRKVVRIEYSILYRDREFAKEFGLKWDMKNKVWYGYEPVKPKGRVPKSVYAALLNRKEKVYIEVKCRKEDKDIPSAAGLNFDFVNKIWYTKSKRVMDNFLEKAKAHTNKEYRKEMEERKAPLPKKIDYKAMAEWNERNAQTLQSEGFISAAKRVLEYAKMFEDLAELRELYGVR